MSKTLAVAKYLNELNVERYGCDMDEMKMHKMMYFSQRESLMNTDNPLFGDSFEAWKFCPVLRSVRNEYKQNHMFESVDETLTEEEKRLVAKDEEDSLHDDRYSWIDRPEEFYTMEEFEEKFGRILRDIDDEIKKWNEKKQKVTQLFATIKDTEKDTDHEH